MSKTLISSIVAVGAVCIATVVSLQASPLAARDVAAADQAEYFIPPSFDIGIAVPASMQGGDRHLPDELI